MLHVKHQAARWHQFLPLNKSKESQKQTKRKKTHPQTKQLFGEIRDSNRREERKPEQNNKPPPQKEPQQPKPQPIVQRCSEYIKTEYLQYGNAVTPG